MTGRIARAAASVALAAASAGCLSFYEVTVETPIRAKLDITPYRQVLVAGFVAGGTKNIDADAETARLLRSQLRAKTSLKVVDADPVDVTGDMQKRLPAAAPAGGTEPGKPAEAARPIRDDKDLKDYEPIFKDQDYWKRVGSEYQDPLIITGTVLFTEVARSGVVSKLRQYTDSMGRVQYEDVREYANLKGYSLTPTFVFIDGRTGAQVYSQSFYEEALYNESLNTPALSSYFELMDKLLPGFLNALSTQSVRGTRVLLVR